MKSSVLPAVLLLLVPAFATDWQTAAPGYRYEFPRDHFNHPDYQTEWWYYTGNLRSTDGHRFGFELTFFRSAINLPPRLAAQSSAAWRPDHIYLAHLALSDLDGKVFYHSERLNRAGPGLAGSRLSDRQYWNGNWHVQWNSLPDAHQELVAIADQFTLRLELHPSKPPVIHGQNGISQKGPQPSQASHYISFTRIEATGQLQRPNQTLTLSGLAWMDHEFFSEDRNSSLAGWDWFAIQLDNNQELMLYRLRQKSGQPDPYSSGTYIDSHGASQFLKPTDFSLRPGSTWKSPHSNAPYPQAWIIDVPSLDLHLQERTSLQDQELFSKSAVTPSYWEGAVEYHGQQHAAPVHGVGYLEMTGYDKAVWLRQR